jgi:hypothetical protein
VITTFIERPGLGGISYPAAATHNGQATASPGQSLVDDVTRKRAKFELRQVSPMPLSATNARDAAHVGAGVGSPSSDERRAQEVTSSIGRMVKIWKLQERQEAISLPRVLIRRTSSSTEDAVDAIVALLLYGGMAAVLGATTGGDRCAYRKPKTPNVTTRIG